LCAQRFRLVQAVSNCQLITPGGEQLPLSPEQRSALLDALETRGDLTFTQAKTAIKVSRQHKFTFEAGGEDRFVGNRTNARLLSVFGPRWNPMPPAEKEQVIHDLRSFRDETPLAARGRNHWGLAAEAAAAFAAIELEPGYANLSRKAIERLLPLMEQGVPYSTAVKQVYGEFDARTQVQDLLPPVQLFSEIRNPVVARTLTEVRKVVNHVIRRHGKPATIRIELARDIRRNQAERQRSWQDMRKNEQDRRKAAKRILDERGIDHPSPDDILKVQLAEECDFTCPYTGRRFSMADLLGANPSADIEHIIPFSRSLDDSYVNKTLCYHEVNRNVKGNRTPLEAFGGTPEWETILQRVSAFRGARAEKLRRFKMTTEEVHQEFEDFPARYLNDTRYAAKLAMQYLATLYGGLSDQSGRRRIEAAKGGVTKYIRQVFDLNRLLNDGPAKTRDDHRHHAVDAVAIGLSSPGIIKRLSEAAVRSWERRARKRHFDPIDEPWPGFLTDVRAAVDKVVASHRPNRKVGGPLHEETIYAKAKRRNPRTGEFVEEFRVRKPIHALSEKDVEEIVDDRVRSAIQAALEQRKLPPKEAFNDRANHPTIQRGNGQPPLAIHRVTIRVRAHPHKIGREDHERYVSTASNHHMEVFAVLDDLGHEVRWDGKVVDQLEAMRRLNAGENVVQRDHGPKTRFKFSLACGDTVAVDKAGKEPPLGVIRSVWMEDGKGRVCFVAANDARKLADMKKGVDRFTPVVDTLRKLAFRRIIVSPLGEIRAAHD
jgi:CRISPR-associated endonuclease Csn1